MTPQIDIGQKLLETFNGGNVEDSIKEIAEYRQNMTNPQIGASHVGWITEPINLTKIHQALIEHLKIPPRLLAIKRLQMSRTRRAVLLTTAMENAIRKVHKEV